MRASNVAHEPGPIVLMGSGETAPAAQKIFHRVFTGVADGVRMVSNLVGCDPAEVKIGMPVRVSIEHVDEATVLPVFRPAR